MLIKNILVAVDFNEAVGEMITYAESFAEKFEAKVWLVHVADPDPDLPARLVTVETRHEGAL